MSRAASNARPPGESNAGLAAALEAEILSSIPIARTMGIRAGAYEGEALTLAAPLAPNVNDKGCAFGGSLVSLMTLAGWGLVKLALENRGEDCEIYVQDSDVRYLAPVWNDFAATARFVERDGIPPMLDALAARGRARTRVRCAIALADGSAAATLEARFVAIRKR